MCVIRGRSCFSLPVDHVLCRLSLGDFAMGNNFEQIMAQLAAQHEPLPQPTSRDVLKSMSHIKVTSAASAAAPSTAGPGEHPASDGAAPAAKAGEACTVCHDEFVDGMEVAQLPGCGHCFHDDCITPWLEQVRPHGRGVCCYVRSYPTVGFIYVRVSPGDRVIISTARTVERGSTA